MMDFKGIRKYILSYLEKMLDSRYLYHSIDHTLQVEQAVIEFAIAENLSQKDIILLRTAALFHDTGYITQYKNNEAYSAAHFKEVATKFEYSDIEISIVERLIMVTARDKQPTDILDQLICDADHDYIGTNNYHQIAQHLRNELEIFGELLTEEEWLVKQIDYLEKEHQYYTSIAKQKREDEKKARIIELKSALLNLKE